MILPTKPYRQKPGFCGPASLKIILDYYGLEKTEEELVNLAGSTAAHGTSSEDLIRTAKKLGFSAFQTDCATYTDMKQWLRQKIPVIVDWFSQDDGHYSVVVGLDENNIYLQDPELGQMRAMKKNDFFRVWFDFPGDYLQSKEDVIIRRMIVIKPKSNNLSTND